MIPETCSELLVYGINCYSLPDKDGSVIYCDGPGKVPEQAPVVKVDAALPPHLAHPVDEDIKDDGLHRVHKEKDLISLLSCTVGELIYFCLYW